MLHTKFQGIELLVPENRRRFLSFYHIWDWLDWLQSETLNCIFFSFFAFFSFEINVMSLKSHFDFCLMIKLREL